MGFLELLELCHQKGISFSLQNDQVKIGAPQGALTQELTQRLRQFKPDLIEWLHLSASVTEFADTAPARIPLLKQRKKVRASCGQEQLWLVHKLDAVGDGYHFVRVLHLHGELHEKALNEAFSAIYRRHEALRTVLVEEGDLVFQEVRDASPVTIPVVDLSSVEEKQRMAARDHQRKLATTPFDLARDPMLRLQLIHLGDGQYQLLIVLHHLASDGWSLSVLMREFQTLYTQYVQGARLWLPDLPVQYVDYSQWSRDSLQGESYNASLNYWNQRLSGVADIHNLPLDYPRPLQQCFRGGKLETHLNAAAMKGLKSLAQDFGATLFMVLHGLFTVLLGRYAGTDDVVVGTPVANRSHEDITGLIGYFVNMLPLRHRVDPSLSLNQYLRQVKSEVFEAFKHQQVPFDKVVREVIKTRSASYSPLIQVVFVLQNNEIPQLSLPNLVCEIHELERRTALFELELEATETATGLTLCWTYAASLFEEATVTRMTGHFDRLVQQALVNPDRPLKYLDILTTHERHQQLVDCHPVASYPEGTCIHELFEAQVASHPDKVAAVCGERQMTYTELNEKSNQLAHYLLREKGVEPDTLVGLCVERSLDMIVGILGILKAGGAYVPLDADYPEARLTYMLADAQVRTVITQSTLLGQVPISEAQAICLDDAETQKRLGLQLRHNPEHRKLGLTPNHLAYVIYTSGSTGKPKGVMIEHKSLVCSTVNRLSFYERELKSFLLLSSVAFDSSVAGIFWSLTSGATLVVAHQDTVRDMENLVNVIQKNAVNYLLCVPSLYKEVINYCIDSHVSLTELDGVILAGEALPASLAKIHHEVNCDSCLYNEYGPTEACVWSSVYKVPKRVECATIPIGQSPGFAQLYVLDSVQALVPQGVPGELYIGGPALARGYLNNTALTNVKFIQNPFYNELDTGSSKRLYRTGDLVRRLSDGNLEFLGRIDQQVKIRGLRIELGEIENILLSHEGIKDAVVAVKEPSHGAQSLVAYLVLNAVCLPLVGEKVADRRYADELRSVLSQHLPDYMIPSVFLMLDSLPLMPNGKVDRRALPDPGSTELQNDCVAPKTPEEELLCQIFQKVLSVSLVGVNDSFFSLGGDSLSTIRVMSLLRKKGYVLPPTKIFECKDIGDLATYLTPEQDAAMGNDLEAGVLPLTSAQHWFFNTIKVDPSRAEVGMIVRYNVEDPALFETAFNNLVAHHAALRARFHKKGSEWIQTIMPPESIDVGVEVFDLAGLDSESQLHEMGRLIKLGINGFDLESGPLLKLSLFYIDQNRGSFIRLALHHLLVDGYSYSLLLEDLKACYEALLNKRAFDFPKKGASIMDRVQHFEQYVNSVDGAEEVKYWESLPWSECSRVMAPGCESAAMPPNLASFEERTFGICKEEIDFVLSLLVEQKISTVNFIIFLVSKALRDVSSNGYVLTKVVDVARNTDALDVSRTVGWLAISRIILLNMDLNYEDPVNALCAVDQQISNIPGRGIGYELIQYHHADENIRRRFAELARPECLVNFHGEIEGVSKDALIVDKEIRARGYGHSQFSPDNLRDMRIVFDAAMVDGRLEFSVKYSNKEFCAETIKGLASSMHDSIRSISMAAV